VPAKGAGDASPSSDASGFTRPADELVRRAARRVVRGGRASFPSQASFRDAVLAEVRRDDPRAALGGVRLRRLTIGVPGVRLTVHYAERPGEAPPTACPVCGSELVPIHNRTLSGDTIVLGRRCSRCDYWSHAHRRVPVRYAFSRAGSGNRSKRPLG
jgi:hypothetical protein